MRRVVEIMVRSIAPPRLPRTPSFPSQRLASPPLFPDGYWQERLDASWEALHVGTLTAEQEDRVRNFPRISVPLSAKRRGALLRAGILAVRGSEHVVILSDEQERAWELRDAVIEILKDLGCPDEGIKRLHGWEKCKFRKFLSARLIGVEAFADQGHDAQKRKRRRSLATTACAERLVWMDAARILVMRFDECGGK